MCRRVRRSHYRYGAVALNEGGYGPSMFVWNEGPTCIVGRGAAACVHERVRVADSSEDQHPPQGGRDGRPPAQRSPRWRRRRRPGGGGGGGGHTSLIRGIAPKKRINISQNSQY